VDGGEGRCRRGGGGGEGKGRKRERRSGRHQTPHCTHSHRSELRAPPAGPRWHLCLQACQRCVHAQVATHWGSRWFQQESFCTSVKKFTDPFAAVFDANPRSGVRINLVEHGGGTALQRMDFLPTVDFLRVPLASEYPTMVRERGDKRWPGSAADAGTQASICRLAAPPLFDQPRSPGGTPPPQRPRRARRRAVCRCALDAPRRRRCACRVGRRGAVGPP